MGIAVQMSVDPSTPEPPAMHAQMGPKDLDSSSSGRLRGTHSFLSCNKNTCSGKTDKYHRRFTAFARLRTCLFRRTTNITAQIHHNTPPSHQPSSSLCPSPLLRGHAGSAAPERPLSRHSSCCASAACELRCQRSPPRVLARILGAGRGCRNL